VIQTTSLLYSQSVKTGLTWELPLGTVRGQLDEPGPRFVDPYEKEEREAIQALSKLEKG
jgi:hypothetical protein